MYELAIGSYIIDTQEITCKPTRKKTIRIICACCVIALAPFVIAEAGATAPVLVGAISKKTLLTAAIGEASYLTISLATGQEITPGGVIGSGLSGPIGGLKGVLFYAVGGQAIDVLTKHQKEYQYKEMSTDIVIGIVLEQVAPGAGKLANTKNLKLHPSLVKLLKNRKVQKGAIPIIVTITGESGDAIVKPDEKKSSIKEQVR